MQPVVQPAVQLNSQLDVVCIHDTTCCQTGLTRRVAKFRKNRPGDVEKSVDGKSKKKLECGPMPNLMVALPNIGDALCSTPQSLADAHY